MLSFRIFNLAYGKAACCGRVNMNEHRQPVWNWQPARLGPWSCAMLAGFVMEGYFSALAIIPQSARDDPRYKLGYLVVTHYSGVTTNGTGDSVAGLQNALDDAYTNDLVALFPEGTYVISDSLRCFQWWNWRAGGNTFQGGGPYGNKAYALKGSALGRTRPVIKLADSPATNFDDTNNVRPLLIFRLFKQALTKRGYWHSAGASHGRASRLRHQHRVAVQLLGARARFRL